MNLAFRALGLAAVAGVFFAVAAHAGPRDPRPYRVPAALPDVVTLPSPSKVRLTGYLGARVTANEKNRLLEVDENAILAGFRKRPGEQAWIGEHAGKFLHAATLAWAYSGDPALKKKLDRVARELVKTQEPNGYLGTYTPEKRFGLYENADWDVWVHKYDLLGLLTYHQYTGDPSALSACRGIGDLLVRTFGPGKKSIVAAGTHQGMAATSVLEPMVLLYRTTGDKRYLDFARRIVAAYDEPNGPQVVNTLLTVGRVDKTANGKAYEMLSNLVGLCELARATGDKKFLQAATNAWADMVKNQLYLTGSASHGEHFHAPGDLPNRMGANVGETCVTVTWMQLNTQLLRLTGEAKYGDELERSYYNHLAAAQRPDGAEWCYYTSLEGTKPYSAGINCCVSSGPRGMAMLPSLAYFTRRETNGNETPVVNLFEAGRATLSLGGRKVTITQQTDFPRAGRSLLTLGLERPATFALHVRAPEWGEHMDVKVIGPQGFTVTTERGWASVAPRRWKNGDRVTLDVNLHAHLVNGAGGNAGRAALIFGPLVLAYDTERNPGLPAPGALSLTRDTDVDLEQRNEPIKASSEAATLVFTGQVRAGRDAAAKTMRAAFVPFAEAGANGGRYQVWLRAPGTEPPANASLLAFGNETRSRPGNSEGTISDGDAGTFVVTYDGHKAETDWFAVTLDAPAAIRRVAFAHGRAFHDGGWFDVQNGGKPRVEVRRAPSGPWESVGILADYPDTTATNAKNLWDGQTFTLRLAEPQTVVAVRVIGKPACGDNPKQAFASCGELEAFTQ